VALCVSVAPRCDRPNAGHSYVVVSAQFEGTEQKTVVRMGESQMVLVVLPWQATGYSWRVSHYDKAFLDFKQLDESDYHKGRGKRYGALFPTASVWAAYWTLRAGIDCSVHRGSICRLGSAGRKRSGRKRNLGRRAGLLYVS
jgi:hypothetical protein